MELWIRSQDKKKFLKPIYIEMEQTGKKIFLINAKIEQNYDTICVGLYTTEIRALEVLDEIQNILKPTIKIKYEYDDSQPIMNGEWLKSLKEKSKIEELSTYVYEIPKE